MRIPLSNIWRAFPELDRFTDDQCKRFVRSACKRGWQRHFHRAGIGCLTFVFFILCFWAMMTLLMWLDSPFHLYRIPFALLTAALLIVAFGLPAAVAMVIRDRLLLRRIRFVLHTRGSCPSCQYSLLGIVVSAGNIVICPECGMEIEADPSLKELTTDEQGRALFTPSDRIEDTRFWTDRRKRLAKRVAIGLGVFLFVVLPGGWGAYELFLWQQAKTADAERPGVAGIMEFIESHQPPGVTALDVNAFDIFFEAQILRDSITSKVSAQPRYIDDEWGDSYFPIFYEIYAPQSGNLDDRTLKKNRMGRELAEELLVAYREGGVFDTLDSLASARRAVRPLTIGANQPMHTVLLPELGEARVFARINSARMHLALKAGDRDEFLAAFETNLALARMLYHQPFMIDMLVANAIEAMAYNRLRYAFPQHPDADWLDGIEAAIDRQRLSLPRDHVFQSVRFTLLDTVAWFFRDTSNTRFGRFSPGLDSIGGIGGGIGSVELGMRLGTYAENRDTLNEYYDAVAEAALLDPFERTTSVHHPDDLLLLNLLRSSISQPLYVASQLEVWRRGTAVMIALERYYLDHGSYPDTLSVLVPEHLAVLPVDPWTGEPLRYRPIGEGAGTYVLYSVGPDATDDGGGPNIVTQWGGTRNPDTILSLPANDASP